jgi:hypothetical protein
VKILSAINHDILRPIPAGAHTGGRARRIFRDGFESSACLEKEIQHQVTRGIEHVVTRTTCATRRTGCAQQRRRLGRSHYIANER